MLQSSDTALPSGPKSVQRGSNVASLESTVASWMVTVSPWPSKVKVSVSPISSIAPLTISPRVIGWVPSGFPLSLKRAHGGFAGSKAAPSTVADTFSTVTRYVPAQFLPKSVTTSV